MPFRESDVLVEFYGFFYVVRMRLPDNFAGRFVFDGVTALKGLKTLKTAQNSYTSLMHKTSFQQNI